MPQCLLPAFWNELCHSLLLRPPYLYQLGREMSQHTRRTSLVPHPIDRSNFHTKLRRSCAMWHTCCRIRTISPASLEKYTGNSYPPSASKASDPEGYKRGREFGLSYE